MKYFIKDCIDEAIGLAKNDLQDNYLRMGRDTGIMSVTTRLGL